MTPRQLNSFISKYLKLFRKDIFVSESLLARGTKNGVDHSTVMSRMTELKLIKPSNRFVDKEWTLGDLGIEVIKYFTWRIYLSIKFVKGLFLFLGGLITIFGVIGTITFAYLTYERDNKLDKEEQRSKRLSIKLDSLHRQIEQLRSLPSLRNQPTVDSSKIDQVK